MSKPIGAPTAVDKSSKSADGWAGLLEHYRQTAVHILGSHLRVGTQCSSCGQNWPCRAACAAELALEL